MTWNWGPERTAEFIDLFWSRVDRTDANACWEWSGYCGPEGYGRMGWSRKKHQCTHLALEFSGIPRPSVKHYALHKCDNRPCINPSHLYWGTHDQNMDDMKRSRRRLGKTHHKIPDMTGQRYSRLTVLGPAGYSDGTHLSWTCACSCGAIVNRVGARLRNGRNKSCGCLRRDNAAALGSQ